MKRKFLMFISILGLSLGLVACNTGRGEKADLSQAPKEEPEVEEIIQEDEPPVEDESLIIKADQVDLTGYNLVDKVDFDFEEGGSLELYTSAQLDENSQPLLDDGQDWLLIAKDQTATYILFQDYIQLGKIDFNAFTLDQDFIVTIKVSGTASLDFGEFKYNKADKSFIYREKYSQSDNVNMIYES